MFNKVTDVFLFRLQVRISCVKMAKRTRKVGITGKYGTRYGASLRKVVKKESGQILSFSSTVESIGRFQSV